MPNHVTNRIELYGDQENINKVLELIEGERECIDFNKIIPMPDNIFRGNLGPEERNKYGKNNWYDWSLYNWGTKWNAYNSNFDADNNAIEFDTAWSCPISVLNKLAEMCHEHNISFDGKWADEDCGFNVGTFESTYDGDDGWLNYAYVEHESHEAYQIYIELKGKNDCLSKDNNGHWMRHDCNNCPNPC